MSIRVTELHSIMPIANIPSVMQHGILCHEAASRLTHHDVSMQPIQDRSDKVQVPQGLKLHQYANLYFDARNPMLYKRQAQVHALCILRVSTEVFNIAGAVITDQNASSNYVRFFPPTALNQLQLDKIYAEDWTHPNLIDYWQHKSQKCAEVLIPYRIPPNYIIGAYVINQTAKTTLQNTGFTQPITINSYLFFR